MGKGKKKRHHQPKSDPSPPKLSTISYLYDALDQKIEARVVAEVLSATNDMDRAMEVLMAMVEEREKAEHTSSILAPGLDACSIEDGPLPRDCSTSSSASSSSFSSSSSTITTTTSSSSSSSLDKEGTSHPMRGPESAWKRGPPRCSPPPALSAPSTTPPTSEPPISPEEAWDILCGIFEGMASVDLLMSAFEAAHCDLPSAIEELGRRLGDHESLVDVEEEGAPPHQGGGGEEAEDMREVAIGMKLRSFKPLGCRLENYQGWRILTSDSAQTDLDDSLKMFHVPPPSSMVTCSIIHPLPEQALRTLTELFPGVPREVLTATLDMCEGNLELMAQTILEGGGTGPHHITTPHRRPRPHNIRRASSSPWAPLVSGDTTPAWETPLKVIKAVSTYPRPSPDPSTSANKQGEGEDFPCLPSSAPPGNTSTPIKPPTKWQASRPSSPSPALLSEEHRQILKLKALNRFCCPHFPEDMVQEVFFLHDCNAEIALQALQTLDPETYRACRLKHEASLLENQLKKSITVSNSPPRPVSDSSSPHPSPPRPHLSSRSSSADTSPSFSRPMMEARRLAVGYRERAREAGEAMKADFSRAASAYRKWSVVAGDITAAGAGHRRQMLHYHSCAVTTLLSSSCPSLVLHVDEDMGVVSVVGLDPSKLQAPILTLDFHGLTVPEAIKLLQTLIPIAAACCEVEGVHLIVGLGNHSKGGRPRLLPAVMKLLSKDSQRDLLKYQVQAGTVVIKFRRRA